MDQYPIMSMQSFTYPPDDWPDQDSSGLFHSKLWANLMNTSFPVQTLFLKINTSFHLMTVFKAGPFHVGYLDFPICNPETGEGISNSFLEDLLKFKYGIPIDLIRITISAFSHNEISIQNT